MADPPDEPSDATDASVAAILDLLGDERTRRVLAVVDEEPRSAKAIAEVLDLSLPTVYRRLENLEDHGLVVGRTQVADDGNHYQVFECNFDSTVIALEDGTYETRVFRRGNVPDGFARLWDDLSRGSK